MIVTITPNPAVDITYQINQLTYDHVHRVNQVLKTAGGKGINVARVLKQLEENVGAMGFVGGALGNFIQAEIRKQGIKDFFMTIRGETRNCIAIIHDNGQQTEILESGPNILRREGDAFLDLYTKVIQEATLITISGSLPEGLDETFYETLLRIADKMNKHVILDTNGEVLRNMSIQQTPPFMITPNETEFATLVGKPMHDDKAIVAALKSDLFKPLPWVVVTRGADGAVVKYRETIYQANIPRVTVKNPVGSGDAVVAGFAAGLMRQLPVEKIIAYGMTIGILNAMEEKTGHINPEHLENIIKQVTVEKIHEGK